MARTDRALRVVPGLAGLPGTVRLRSEVPAPAAYAVVDLETTGTSLEADEIVSLAVVRLDADGLELDRFASLVRPAGPIPPEATAVHGIDDASVAHAPGFAELARELLSAARRRRVRRAQRGPSTSRSSEHAFARAGIRYRPDRRRVHARRVPAARAGRRGATGSSRSAYGTASRSTTRTTRAATCSRPWSSSGSCSARASPQETVELDHGAYMRGPLARRHATRLASRRSGRVFASARSAGLVRPDGSVDADAVSALVARVAGGVAVEELTREQVQEVYDELERLIDERPVAARAASG